MYNIINIIYNIKHASVVSPTAAMFYFVQIALEPSPEPVEPNLALHQGFLEASPEPSPEPC